MSYKTNRVLYTVQVWFVIVFENLSVVITLQVTASSYLKRSEYCMIRKWYDEPLKTAVVLRPDELQADLSYPLHSKCKAKYK